MFCTVMVLCIHAPSYAQNFVRVNQYSVTSFQASWTDISATGDTFRYNKVDQGWGTIVMPFDFPYDGTVVPTGTKINIGASGAIALSPDTTPSGPSLDSAAYPGFVCVFSGGVVEGTGHASPADSDYYEMDGIAPNRVLTVEYHFMHMPGTGSGSGGPGANMVQVKFYETTGIIEFIYQSHNNAFESGNSILCGIGLNGFSTPSFVANVYETNMTATPASDLRWTPSSAGVVRSAAPSGCAIGNCYPNPAQGSVLIPITLAEEGNPRIEVRAASGALVAFAMPGVMTAGNHSVPLEVQNLTSGVYFCTLICGGAQATNQLTIVR